jgi:hypothetical protein
MILRVIHPPTRLLGSFLGIGIVATVASTVLGATPASAATAPVGLGTAASFAVLGGSTVTNTGPSVINGDLGVSPGSAVTGLPPGVVNGAIYQSDAVAGGAQADVTTAYDGAAGRTPATAVPVELGGTTLAPGVYSGGTLGLTGTLTLDAQGDPTAVFVFQTESTLITASASSVALVNGADACNVFWKVGSSATLGTASNFTGTILALTAISAQTGAVIEGRLLARNAAVTLDDNTITKPACNTPSATTSAGTTTSTGTATSTDTGTGTGTGTATGTATTTIPALVVVPPTSTIPGTTTRASTTMPPTATGSTPGGQPPLARTGTPLLVITAVALLAGVVGGMMLLASRRSAAGPTHRR